MGRTSLLKVTVEELEAAMAALPTTQLTSNTRSVIIVQTLTVSSSYLGRSRSASAGREAPGRAPFSPDPVPFIPAFPRDYVSLSCNHLERHSPKSHPRASYHKAGTVARHTKSVVRTHAANS